ncbi:hypothetical protein PoB_000364200 [Plakobranchus ocellatus]|uniref:Uncharacterized protein n=1 Tax=Plakobranchus ocellatus TaxID=259542 RepID=A0AAV3Y4V5_9GAST|nr:hypothetical protein PoB_000364200 [Plakobranchus ocellatus]
MGSHQNARYAMDSLGKPRWQSYRADDRISLSYVAIRVDTLSEQQLKKANSATSPFISHSLSVLLASFFFFMPWGKVAQSYLLTDSTSSIRLETVGVSVVDSTA